ncbi:MAG: hypothetical protein NEHIOOID_00588 [Holosporales bacterium]
MRNYVLILFFTAINVFGAQEEGSAFNDESQRVINAVHSYFHEKKFKIMSPEVKRDFISQKIQATDKVQQLLVCERYMQLGYINAVDHMHILSESEKSESSDFFVLLSLLARLKGSQQSYSLAPSASNQLCDILRGQNITTELTKIEINNTYIKYSMNTYSKYNKMKKTEKFSPFFAFCIYSIEIKESKMLYFQCLLEDFIFHKPDGSTFPSQQDRYNYASGNLYAYINKLKKQQSSDKEFCKLDELLCLFSKAVIHLNVNNPTTNQPFKSEDDKDAFLRSFLGNRISKIPSVQMIIQDNPKVRFEMMAPQINKPLSEVSLLILETYIFEHKFVHPEIEKMTREFIRRYTPTPPTITSSLQHQYILKRIADLQEEKQYWAISKLAKLSIEECQSYFFEKAFFDLDLSISQLRMCLNQEKDTNASLKAAIILKLTELSSLYRYSEEEHNRIEQLINPKNQGLSHENRFDLARYLPLNLREQEAYLSPLFNVTEKNHDEKAYSILLDKALEDDNAEKALEYVTALVHKTKNEKKRMYQDIMIRLKNQLTPKSPPKVDASSDEKMRDELLKREEYRKQEDALAEKQRILELRKAQKSQLQEDVDTSKPSMLIQLTKEKPPLTIHQTKAVLDDLEKTIFKTGSALKQNYDDLTNSLRNGVKPNDVSKYVGRAVTDNNSTYALWHCRLNSEHRVFYYQIGLNVYIIQAGEHDLIPGRL